MQNKMRFLAFFMILVILCSTLVEGQSRGRGASRSAGRNAGRGRIADFQYFGGSGRVTTTDPSKNSGNQKQKAFPSHIPNANLFAIPAKFLYDGFGEEEDEPELLVDAQAMLDRPLPMQSQSPSTKVNRRNVKRFERKLKQFNSKPRPISAKGNRTKPQNPESLKKQQKVGKPNSKKIFERRRDLREKNTAAGNYIVRYKTREVQTAPGAPRAIKEAVKAAEKAERGIKVQARALEMRRASVSGTVNGLSNSGLVILEDVKSRSTLEDILADPDVEYIEGDVPTALACEEHEKTGPERFYPWGVDRLDNYASVIKALNNANTNDTVNKVTYEDYSHADDPVGVYVIDTGIYAEHPDFQGRARMIWSKWPNLFTDGHGHGTHVAGIIGGRWSGVSHKPSIYGLKAMPDFGNGNISSIVEAIEFVIQDHSARKRRSGYAKSIINLSITTLATNPISFAAEEAVREAVKAGIPVVVAAGNQNDNANKYSPGRIPEAITVGATDYHDALASFSNYGDVIDILAPGYNIPSASIPPFFNSPRAPPLSKAITTDPDVTANTFVISYRSGTSQAAPHVSGVLATLMQFFKGPPPPAYIFEAYIKFYSWPHATMGTTQKGAGTPNAIASTRFCV